jgi:ribosomal protein S18 acetylase RimI-like enzyme
VNSRPLAGLALRHAQPADAPAIWAVHTRAIRECCAEHYTPAEIAAWSGRMTPASYRDPIRLQRIVVAETDTPEGPRIVGFGQLQGAEGVIEAIYVDPDFARRGIGTALVATLLDTARRAGLPGVVLDASQNSVPFYRALGFRDDGPARHALAPGVRLACTVMTKPLGPR